MNRSTVAAGRLAIKLAGSKAGSGMRETSPDRQSSSWLVRWFPVLAFLLVR